MFGGQKMKKPTVMVLVAVALTLAGLASADEPRTFTNWRECFRFMVGDSDTMLQSDDDTLFKLAAESSMDRVWLGERTNRIVIVVKLDYLKGPYSALRGAQDNGLYYLFVPVENGFQYVGRMEGNGFKWGTPNGKARFTTNWHMSASESYENIYDWNGKMFRQTSRILYHYELDGNRKEVKEPNTSDGIRQPANGSPNPTR